MWRGHNSDGIGSFILRSMGEIVRSLANLPSHIFDVLQGLRLNFPFSGLRKLWSATDAEIVPQAEPRTLGQHLVMSPVCSRHIACAERPDIRCFEHLLKLLDFVNDALDIHKHTV